MFLNHSSTKCEYEKIISSSYLSQINENQFLLITNEDVIIHELCESYTNTTISSNSWFSSTNECTLESMGIIFSKSCPKTDLNETIIPPIYTPYINNNSLPIAKIESNFTTLNETMDQFKTQISYLTNDLDKLTSTTSEINSSRHHFLTFLDPLTGCSYKAPFQ